MDSGRDDGQQQQRRFVADESADPPFPAANRPQSDSRQSSLSVGSEEVRVLGAPLSDRSESEEEEGKKGPKILVDERGRNVEEAAELERKEEDSLRDFEEQEREVARQLAMEEEEDEGMEEGGGGKGEAEEGDEGDQLMENIPEEDEDEEEHEGRGEEGRGDEKNGGAGREDEGEGGLWRMEAVELPRSSQSRVSESLQNRQFPGADELRDDPNLKQSPANSSPRSSLGGYPLDYPTDPPPAYTSPRAISRGRLFVGERPNTSSAFGKMMTTAGEPAEEEKEKATPIHGYAVPSPRFDGPEEEGDSSEEEWGVEGPRGVAAESNAKIRAAIGSSFALAGGMAAAVAATTKVGAADVKQIGGQKPSPQSPWESPRMLVQGARTAADLIGSKREVGGGRPESAGRHSSTAGGSESGQQQRFPVSAELKGLFKHIEDFVAERMEIDPALRPFQIDYIPAVGDVDPFIKVPRPDENDDLQLGLAVLDEPAASQSDPAIVDLRLHQMAGKSGSADAPVKKLSRADRNAHQIDRWIQSVRELRRTKPPDRVHYSKPMPSIEALMQEWPQSVEQKLKGMKLLLNANLDAALEDYVDLCLALVDVPVHKSRLEALHLFFSLYAEFRNSQHFRNLALGQEGERGGTAPTIVDNFVLDEEEEAPATVKDGGGGQQQQRNILEDLVLT